MTAPTLTCDHCESEIGVANDPRCVVYDPSGATDVICEACRKRAYRRKERSLENWTVSDTDRLAYRIKRGWRA